MDFPDTLSNTPVDHLSMNCAAGSVCSPSVALLTIVQRDQSRQCLGSLVGEGLIVTASHCLPDDLHKPGVGCRGMVRVGFPAVGGFSEVQVDCQEVVSASPYIDRSQGQLDFAFIRLASRVDRPVLRVDHSGLSPNIPYTAIQVEQSQIVSRMCHAIHGSEALPGSVQAKSSVIAMGDCETTAYNEGGPILDAQGLIRGILQSQAPKERLANRIGSRRQLERRIPSISYATNFACIRLPEEDDEGFVIPSACRDNPNNGPSLEEQSKTLLPKAVEQTRSQMDWPRLIPELKWDTLALLGNSEVGNSEEGKLISKALGLTSPFSHFVIPVPTCISGNNPPHSTNLRLPVVGYNLALDRDLIVTLDPGRSLGDVYARVEIDGPSFPWDWITDQGKSVRVFVGRKNGRMDRVFLAPLPECTR